MCCGSLQLWYHLPITTYFRAYNIHPLQECNYVYYAIRDIDISRELWALLIPYFPLSMAAATAENSRGGRGRHPLRLQSSLERASCHAHRLFLHGTGMHCSHHTSHPLPSPHISPQYHNHPYLARVSLVWAEEQYALLHTFSATAQRLPVSRQGYCRQ